MALDRRKVVHRGTSNLLFTLDATSDAISEQLASGDLDNWANAKADAQNMQSTLTTQHAALLNWYTTWRGAEPPEPPQPAYLGVFGTEATYESNLKNTGSIPRTVRNNYTAASMIAMAYEELYSIAVALQSDATGLQPIAMTGLTSIIESIKSLSETMCTATVRELHNEDNSISMSNATTAIAATQDAWK